jgi:hypothetical protein
MFAQVVGAATVTTAAALLPVEVRQVSLRAALPLVSLLIASVLLTGYFYSFSNVSWVSYLLVVVAPHTQLLCTAALIRSRSPRVIATLRSALVAGVLSVAFELAVQAGV